MGRIDQQTWPEPDPSLTALETIELPVQVNGRLRDRIQVSPTATEAEVRKLIESKPRVTEYLQGREPTRVIYVPGRMINLVLQ